MTPLSGGDWAAVNDLFHRALDEPPDRRKQFLDEACASNPSLRAEVESLLAAHDRAADFIERPAVTPSGVVALGEDAADPLVGQTLGQYRIARVLGEGGMGIVYLADDARLGRAVALKALAPRFTDDPTRRERLRREARAAASLTHPGIATVYALEEFDHHLFIACEYVPGETLREELRRGALSIPDVIETASHMGQALAAAHERGIIHRDLKPENVIRSTGGQIKILDFGLARFSDSPLAHLTDDGTKLGTPAYMAPEQIRGQAVDARADLFAFGIVLFELCAGAHPFAGSDAASTVARILEAEPARLNRFRIADPPVAAEWQALEGIIHRCLQKSPADRFQSAQELLASLQALRDGAGTAGAPRQRTPDNRQVRATDAAARLWWWQFHQAAVCLAYVAMLWPLSYVRGTDRDVLGLGVFLVGLVGVLVASTLRLHLWFTHRSYPSEWDAQRRRAALWIRVADLTFVGIELVGAAMLLTTHPHVAMLLVGAAVAEFLAFTIIEPATTRAAFRE